MPSQIVGMTQESIDLILSDDKGLFWRIFAVELVSEKP
jgi:hypothetical protein